jgi:IMP dehydrogenase/GMP reductase
MKIKFHEIKKEKIELNESITVYDLTIDGDHSYTVSENNIIVHNCLTTQQLGVGYPMASLIQECYQTRKDYGYQKTLIVADGGMQTYSDIIKALALGADYVMLGSILNKALESAGNTYWLGGLINTSEERDRLYHQGEALKKQFQGMSTKEVQQRWKSDRIKTAEGITRYYPVEYTIGQWTENFEDYLRSAMSYTNSKNLKEFIGQVKVEQISQNAYIRFNK